MLKLDSAARDLETRCRDAGSADRAVSERPYLKSDLEHFGVSVWAIRRIAKDFVKYLGAGQRDAVLRAAGKPER